MRKDRIFAASIFVSQARTRARTGKLLRMRAKPLSLLPFLVIACSTPDAKPERPLVEPPSTTAEVAPVEAPEKTPSEPPDEKTPVTTVTAGPGLGVGPTPELPNPVKESGSLERDGTTISAHAHWVGKSDEQTTQLQVRIELAGKESTQGINYVGGGGEDYCDELSANVQEIAVLADDRWLVDAQLTCRGGEDFFEATNEHVLLLVEAAKLRAEILWTGIDTGSNAMGICESSLISSFVLDATMLRIVQTSETTFDRKAAREIGFSDECKPKPLESKEVAALDLTPAP